MRHRQRPGLAAGDAIDLTDIVGSRATLGYAPSTDGTGGTLTVGDGTHGASIALLGQYMAAGLGVSADQAGGTVVTYTPPPASSSDQSSLTNPH